MPTGQYTSADVVPQKGAYSLADVDLTTNKVNPDTGTGYGTYQMKGHDGKTVGIPYFNVHEAMGQGLNFANPGELEKFQKDYSYRQEQIDPYLKSLTPSAGGIAEGAISEAGNLAKGVGSLFAKPDNALELAAGPALPAFRAVKGYIDSAGTGLHQAGQYASTGQPVRSAVTAVGALNPFSSAQTASINRNVDQGAPISNVIGQGLTDAGTLAAPSTVVPLLKGAGRVALLGRTPVEAYESALKIPPTSLSSAERAAVAQTSLENEIPISKGGLEKLGDLIDDLNGKIKDQIASDPNRPIDPNAVATRLNDTSQRFSNQVVAQPDLDAIAAQRQQFLSERGAQPGKPGIPPQPTGVLDAQGRPIMTQGTPATPPQPAPPMNAIDAQAMKQGTYTILRKKYGEQGSAVVESQKALARGIKEEIAAKFPEINDLNAAESRLLDLQPVLERAVNRISNHQFVGIGTPIVGTAVKMTTGSNWLGATAMTLKGIVDNPFVKSRLAIAVSKGGNMPFAQAMARVSAYAASLGSAVPDSQANSSDGTPNPAASPAP